MDSQGTNYLATDIKAGTGYSHYEPLSAFDSLLYIGDNSIRDTVNSIIIFPRFDLVDALEYQRLAEKNFLQFDETLRKSGSGQNMKLRVPSGDIEVYERCQRNGQLFELFVRPNVHMQMII